MNKIFTYLLTAAAALSIASCDSIFDNLEGDLTKMSAEDMTSSEDGFERLLANMYAYIPMGAYESWDQSTPNATDCNTTDGNNAYGGGVGSFWNYTVMRDVNSFIVAIDQAKEKGTISDGSYNAFMGEALFVRAYYYFGSVRVYGGVPIVTEPLDGKFDGGDNEGLYIPRSTEKETWDFIISELDKAASMLPESRSGSNYRATKWSALALKARVALWAASTAKYWDKAPISSTYKAVSEKLAYMDKNDANAYYEKCIAACQEIINSGKFSLYKPNPASEEEAIKNYSDLFLDRHNEEFIFGRTYRTGVSTDSNNYFDLKNSPYQTRDVITAIWRWGRFNVTLDMVDAYDNYDANHAAVDGTIKTRKDNIEDDYVSTPSLAAGETAIRGIDFIEYDSPSGPFENKEARFKASVIYPGIQFRGKTINIQAGIWRSDDRLLIYDENFGDCETLNGKSYYPLGGSSRDDISAFFWMGNTNDGSWYTTGFGLRKYLKYDKVDTYSQTPWCDLSYTEVLLNYAEALVEKGGTNAGDSKAVLNQIRKRAFFSDQKDATIENIMKERRIELAFSNDYASTLWRRRAFFEKERDLNVDKNGGRKHALLPVVTLKGGEAKYIFVRANEFGYDIDRKPAVASFDSKSYYKAIPSYDKNGITENPIQQ